MTSHKRKNKIHLLPFLLIFLLLWLWSWVPFTEKINLDIPEVKDTNVRLVLVTDLHSCFYGKNQSWLIKMIRKQNPDIVALSGDIFDDKLKNNNAEIFVEEIVKEYPVYYVTGNHEYWNKNVPEMKNYLRNLGVHVLEGSTELININGCNVNICGVDDPVGISDSNWKKQLENAYSSCDSSNLKILLSHRPERIEYYKQYNFDLVLAGHAHAGQIKIPFINRGLWAPSQGFLPKYVSGPYKLKNGSTMIVSRGLARESTPAPRFFNHPEIVVVNIN